MATRSSSSRASARDAAVAALERGLLLRPVIVFAHRAVLAVLAIIAVHGGDRRARAQPPVAGPPAPTLRAAGAPTITYAGPVRRTTPADPREDGDRALAAGRFAEARARYEDALAIDPEDRHALREAGRAAHALRDFEAAASYLRRAAARTPTRDPELHYLLGEAWWALGKPALARQAHLRAKAELGEAPRARIEQLWLARILGRLGDRAAADALYEALITAAPADPEAALARVELHTAVADWDPAERAVRRFLAHAPRHARAREVLAWILEARGRLADEMRLRAALARDADRAEPVRDFGRALERAGDWAGALAAYRRATQLADGADDGELARALARLDQRMAVELGAGASARTDPSAHGLGGFTAMAVPFGRASHWTTGAWHELVSDGARDVYAGEVRGAVALRRGDALAIAGARLGVIDVEADPGQSTPRRTLLAPGAFGSLSSGRLARHLMIVVDGELASVWRETPRAVFEGGRVDAAAAHLYGTALGDRLIIDTGLQARRLRLTRDGGATPGASQLLGWAGADVVAWRDFTREARGQILDDDLLRPTFIADSVVVGYRHYELAGDSDAMFMARLPLADRASIDEVSLTLRKVLAGGRVTVEARGGIGRDWARELNLARGGVSLWLSPGARSRISLSFDLAKESVRAFEGERRTGWGTYHVDL